MTNKNARNAPSTKNRIDKEKLLKEIEKKAYELFIKRNGRHGNDLQDWLEAENIVKKQFGIQQK